MPLPPEAYEEAWESDKSIRTTAEAIFHEWRGKIRQAESAWELTRLIESKQNPDKALGVILGIMAIDNKDEEIGLLGTPAPIANQGSTHIKCRRRRRSAKRNTHTTVS